MRSVFVYRWVELAQMESTWYGSMTRYEMALSRKKGYEEAVFGELVFCTYSSGPLLLYTDGAGEAAFEIAGEKCVDHIREKSADGSLRNGLDRCGLNTGVAAEYLQRLTGEAGFMANPFNTGKFHFLRISLYKGKNNSLYEYDHGSWRYGDPEVYRLLEREYESWGREKK
jgi:hypothetical protein